MTREQLFKLQEAFCVKMRDICAKKNSDYTNENDDVFYNFSRVEAVGIATTEQGIMTRMFDKFSRLTSFIGKKEMKVKDETIEDTCMDLANYAFLLYACMWEKAQKEKHNPTPPAGH